MGVTTSQTENDDTTLSNEERGSAVSPERRHFERFLVVLSSVAGGVSVFEFVGYAVYGERWILIGAITLACYFALLVVVACRWLKRGAINRAVMLTCLGLLAATLVYVVIVPLLYPVLVGIPLLVVATGLPFASVRFLRVLAISAWLTIEVIAAIGTWLSNPSPTSPFLDLLNLVGTGCVSLLVLMLLIQYRWRSRVQLEEVERANKALRLANQELEAFSYSVSHDLRAPLRAIDGYSDALLEDYKDCIDELGIKYLNNLKRGARRMGMLIDDLLSLAQVNRTSLKRSTVDLSELAARIVRDIKPTEQVQIDIQPELKAHVDSTLVEVLLSNLLSNALKFSAHADKPTVSFERVHEGSGDHFVVADNGAGFDMRYVDKLFKPFQRLHTEKEFPGTGIGLATCARVVQKHGGKIWATAAVGHGATIHFTLESEKKR